MRLMLIVIVLLMLQVSVLWAEKTEPYPVYEETGWVSLFNGKDLSGWSNANCAPETWSVKQLEDGPVIHCTGFPTGVLHTNRHYENFILEVEWRHLKPGGNAGVFVWGDPVTARGQPFTRGVEVQVLDGKNGSWYTTHGDVFPIHGARMTPDNGRGGGRSYPVEHRSKPSPEWNHYRVVCNNGMISLAVNGKVVTTGVNASPRKGYLCLESEGSPVQFRNIRLIELPGSGTLTPNDVAGYDEGFEIIYNGVDFRGLKTGAADQWKSSNWTFYYTGEGGADDALVTEKAYEHFEMILDYRIKAESGKVPGKIEIRPGLVIDLPGVEAGVKPKSWQRIEISIDGGLLKVFHNGQIVTYQTVTGIEAGASGVRIIPGGPVDFGNFYIKNNAK